MCRADLIRQPGKVVRIWGRSGESRGSGTETTWGYCMSGIDVSYCRCTSALVENELSADKSPGNRWPGPVLSIVLSIEPLTRNYLSDLSRVEEPIARPISVPLNVICRPGKVICVPLGLLSTCAECSSQFAFLKYLEDPQGVASGDRGPGPREDIDTRVLILVETANRISYNDRREFRGDHCHLSTGMCEFPAVDSS